MAVRKLQSKTFEALGGARQKPLAPLFCCVHTVAHS
jgi:hypothetical protein